MSSVSHPRDFSDLYTDLLNRVRADTSVAATVTQAKRYINIGISTMCSTWGEHFPWLHRQRDAVLTPPYSEGTLSVAHGATSVTGSGTAWTDTPHFMRNVQPQWLSKLTVSGSREVYPIVTVPTDTSLTLQAKYIGADGANASGASYQIITDEIELTTDYERPLDMNYFDDDRSIRLISRQEFRRRFPRNVTPGTPQVATIIYRATGVEDVGASNDWTNRRVRFAPPPNKLTQVQFTYITNYVAVDTSGTEGPWLVTDTDIPIWPEQSRYLIVLHALAAWYRDKKDDQRAREVRAEFDFELGKVISAHEIAQERPSISPRRSHYVSRAKRPWGGRGRRYDTNGAFDRFET